MHRYDLHTHSCRSDGTHTPGELVRRARDAGLALLALTDHDTVDGVSEVLEAGRALGLPVLPAVEIDCEWPEELHMLGLAVDPDDPGLTALLAEAAARRKRRNRQMLERLAALGRAVTLDDVPPGCEPNRMHIALAMCKAGYAESIPDAFARYLGPNGAAYYQEERPSPARVIETILGAGGVPVLAHPCHLRQNPHATVETLSRLGIRGLEAYYTTSTPGQTALFCSLAAQYGLMVTSGSDFHGDNRPGTRLGDGWKPDASLEATYAFFAERL